MSTSSDIKVLFDSFQGDVTGYREVCMENEAHEARDRWPLFGLIGPACAAPGTRRQSPGAARETAPAAAGAPLRRAMEPPAATHWPGGAAQSSAAPPAPAFAPAPAPASAPPVAPTPGGQAAAQTAPLRKLVGAEREPVVQREEIPTPATDPAERLDHLFDRLRKRGGTASDS